MNMFNKFYKFGSTVKPRASLYALGIIFFICITNLYSNITTVNIRTLFETFIASALVALLEYFFFNDYDELSDKKKKLNTISLALLTNIIIISSAIKFSWFPSLPTWIIVALLVILEFLVIAMRYSIYIINLADTKDLNDKLQKYQENSKH